ncbi:Conserved_hypothetical protein [Hexamita inflata]|uniref:Uncharacterized protein n=1 Tax=Hexamita inflata TaxID=28002 RepID=A0AA86UYV2_9EUKA|nr:Conserved hypothetical protein [Hexamita inflata]
MNQMIQTQNQIIEQLQKLINCQSLQGHQFINSSCIEVICEISGQISINGVCQCTNIYSVVQDKACVCPSSSILINNICVCQIIGQTIQSGVCKCSTLGAFVLNGICSCGLNSVNISNVCGCPIGAILQNNACTCSIINAFISDNQCICPLHSSLNNNICTCPQNSIIVGDTCICNSTQGYIMKSEVCTCQTVNSFVQNGVCTCGKYSVNISNVCTCPQKSYLVGDTCVCNISGQIMVDQSCQCQQGYSLIDDQCVQIQITTTTSSINICSKLINIVLFDIQTVTNQVAVSSDFSNGYVFSVFQTIHDAFIQVSSNIYQNIVYPLFQGQSSYKNIKIQLDTQTLGSGVILTNTDLVNINQLKIISKLDTQINVSSGQLNILLTTSNNNIQINNLLINLSFVLSQGNIVLINSIIGNLDINNYQVFGNYQSTQTIALLGLILNTANITANIINFMPSTFCVGNYSSYLFSQVQSSSIYLNQTSIIIGNSTSFQIYNKLSSSQLNTFQFGGIITQILSTSVIINQLILYCYQTLNTDYVKLSGLLIGYSYKGLSSVNISNICLYQQLNSSSQQFKFFGLVGYSDSNISVSQSAVDITVQAKNFQGFGLVGVQSSSCQSSQIVNLKINMLINTTTFSTSTVSAIFGDQEAQKCTILNSIINNCNITSQADNGGIIGFNYFCVLSVQNVSILNSNITSLSNSVGGFIGSSQNCQIQILNSTIQSVKIYSSQNFGIILGCNTVGNTFNIQQSKSITNYINDVIQTNCMSLTNNYSINQC